MAQTSEKNSPPSNSSVVLYGAVGSILVLVLLVAANVLIGTLRLRVDTTDQRVHSLSQGTRDILKQLDAPVTVRLYMSESDNIMPVSLRPYASRVEDLLREYAAVSGGMVELQKLDPRPDTEAEDSAVIDGLEPQATRTGQGVYLGLSFTFVDQKTVIPFLSPDREGQLEYDISRAITQVTAESKPLIGVMAGLPIFGQAPGMEMMMMGGQGTPPWIAIQELQRDFEVREIPLETERIDEDISTLLVIHPAQISELAEYAIDQFLMRGGRLVVAVDPHSLVQASQQNPAMQFMGPQPSSSTLPNLFAAWGVEYDPGSILADATYRTRVNRGGGPEDLLHVLDIRQEATNDEDIVTADLGELIFPMPGALSGVPPEGMRKETLIRSSRETQLIPSVQAEMSGREMLEQFRSSDTEYALAVRLTGKFPSAFPNGRPQAEEDPTAVEDDVENAEEASESETPETDPNHLAEAQAETNVIIFADTDFMFDQFVAQTGQIFGQQIQVLINQNVFLLLNAVEQMAGDSSLISIRSRGSASRPFTVVREMEKEAEEAYRARVASLEAELAETQQRLTQLSQGDQEQRLILSEEQQAELQRFRSRQREINNELRTVRRQLRRDVETLENLVTWINILAMPLLVVLGGATVAGVQHNRRRAQ